MPSVCSSAAPLTCVGPWDLPSSVLLGLLPRSLPTPFLLMPSVSSPTLLLQLMLPSTLPPPLAGCI